MTSETEPLTTEPKAALQAGLISLEDYLKATDNRQAYEVHKFTDTFNRVRIERNGNRINHNSFPDGYA